MDLVACKLRDRGLGFSCLNVYNFPSVSSSDGRRASSVVGRRPL